VSNGNGRAAIDVILAEIDSSISALDDTPGASRCEAHTEVRTALRTLLRCQRAALTLSRDAKSAAAVVGAAAGGLIAGLIETARNLLLPG